METIRHTFGKAEKLKSRKTIELLFKKGKTFNAYPLRIVFQQKESVEEGYLNVGVSVPKRNVKLAVTRNLMKRRMREAYRLNNGALKLQLKNKGIGYDIMFLYGSKQILEYKEVEEKIKVILSRLIELSETVSK